MTYEQAKKVNIVDYLYVQPNMIDIMKVKYDNYNDLMDRFINKKCRVINKSMSGPNTLSFRLDLKREYDSYYDDYSFSQECVSVYLPASEIYKPRKKSNED